jgi:hypothetical protein
MFTRAIDGSISEIGVTEGPGDLMITVSESQNPAPEPATLVLFGSGVLALGFFRRRNTKKGI